MTLKDIALNNLRRRKIKVLFLAFGMVFGVATVVTLFAITNAMQAEMVGNLNESGTRIIIVPKSNKLTFSYGGITVGSSVAYDVKKLPVDAAARVEKLPGVNVVAP
ncbi:MAG: ABC transporter permease, partial [Clostridia bacterium]|nr:ABC transporter permease [Clostridia bacterium]